jgi:hypothetical protein
MKSRSSTRGSLPNSSVSSPPKTGSRPMACPKTQTAWRPLNPSGFRISSWRGFQAEWKKTCVRTATRSGCAPCISAWTPAQQNLSRKPPICTRPMKPQALMGKARAKQHPPTKKRSSSWAVAPTASARASSSIIAACMRVMRCAAILRRSCSIVTRKPYRRIMIPRTVCTSSH